MLGQELECQEDFDVAGDLVESGEIKYQFTQPFPLKKGDRFILQNVEVSDYHIEKKEDDKEVVVADELEFSYLVKRKGAVKWKKVWKYARKLT